MKLRSFKEFKDNNKIKPCPICGYKAKLITTYDKEQVICTNCKVRTEIEVGDYYDEGFMDGTYVIPKWNKGDINNTSRILKDERRIFNDNKIK